MAVTRAVVPVGGLGTRSLPASKAVPKEMLPLVDKPAVQWVVEEAATAGLTDVLLVTGRGKGAVEDHFDRAVELELALEARGDTDALALVRAVTGQARVHTVRQGDPRGLGDAVLAAADHVRAEPFAVLLPDEVVHPSEPLLARMLDVQAREGGSVVALVHVPKAVISRYGCAAVSGDGSDVVAITGLVEKPPVEQAPSDLAVVGRYVLSPAVLDVLRETPPGRGGEVQLTDALAALVGREPVHGVVMAGRRFDAGDRLEHLKATIELTAERDDLGGPLLEWLRAWLPLQEGRSEQ